MAFWTKIAGTFDSWFGLDGESEVAIGKDVSGNMVFKDQVIGTEPTLTELYEGNDDDQVKESVDDGDVFTVKSGHQHMVFDEFRVDGELKIDGQHVML